MAFSVPNCGEHCIAWRVQALQENPADLQVYEFINCGFLVVIAAFQN
jgi:hypothetical protein